MKALLTMKHWQLFLLMIGFPLFVFIGSILSLFTQTASEWAIILIIAAGVLTIILSVLWHYTLTINLLHLYPPEFEFKNANLVKLSIFAPVIFIALMIWSITYFYYNPESVAGSDARYFVILLPLIGIMGVANIYCMYKTAEALVTVELQKKATTGDFIVEFILVWYFWVIGIWILQPRINKIFSRDDQIPAIPGNEFV